VAIESAVILVGEQTSDTLRRFSKILDERKVPYQRAEGILDAVHKAEAWLATENVRLAEKSKEPLSSLTTIDFVGHATQGKFFFGGQKDGTLSACPDSYGRLERLRNLIKAPENVGHTKWGLRLIGCDVSNDGFIGNKFVADNGTVLQFAISWFLQIPVWAPSGPIFGTDFENPDNRVRFDLLEEVSAAASPKVPARLTEAQFNDKLVKAFRRREVPSELQIVYESADYPEFYEYDFQKPMDARELIAEVSPDDAMEIPFIEQRKFSKAYRIFGGRMLLVELLNGERLAYFKKPAAP
jgi:hypothetical protein